MTNAEVIKYWLNGAKEALKTSLVLKQKKRNVHSLFFAHLAIEKLLKGLIIKSTGNHPPPIHNLLKLSEYANINIDEIVKEDLLEINAFNIEARYDDYKNSFYKRARGKRFKKWFLNTQRIYKWLEKLY